jgi:hypothetical protein
MTMISHLLGCRKDDFKVEKRRKGLSVRQKRSIIDNNEGRSWAWYDDEKEARWLGIFSIS